MSRLANAPLDEAIAEIRWGKQEDSTKDNLKLKFDDTELNFFPGQFRGVAASHDFSLVESVNKNLLPFAINYRFRKAPDTWPCYQIGLGIFTANQLNTGYDWKTFKQDILVGASMLDQGHPLTLSKLSIFDIRLIYRDCFIFEEHETPSAFLKEKMKIGFSPPDDLLDETYLTNNVHAHKISFQVGTKTPAGILRFEIEEALINRKKGFLMTTTMLSTIRDFNLEFYSEWLEQAHTTQKHTFEKLIDPSYYEKLK